jgi:hypothetical protein
MECPPIFDVTIANDIFGGFLMDWRMDTPHLAES